MCIELSEKFTLRRLKRKLGDSFTKNFKPKNGERALDPR